MGIKSI